MIVFRRLCLWLLMLALPLQGLAAASMLFCGGKTSERSAAPAPAAHQGQHRHDAGHGHSGHHSASADVDLAAVGADAGSPPDGHKCNMCAYCGHAVALDLFPPTVEFGEPAHTSPPHRTVLIPAMAVLVPDKPPRA